MPVSVEWVVVVFTSRVWAAGVVIATAAVVVTTFAADAAGLAATGTESRRSTVRCRRSAMGHIVEIITIGQRRQRNRRQHQTHPQPPLLLRFWPGHISPCKLKLVFHKKTNALHPPAPTFAIRGLDRMIDATNLTFAELSTFQANEAGAFNYLNRTCSPASTGHKHTPLIVNEPQIFRLNQKVSQNHSLVSHAWTAGN